MPAASEKRLHVFLGSDGARVKEAAQKCVDGLVPEGAGDFGLEAIEGQADHADHAREICARAIEAIQTLPFMGGEKVVWLKAANFLGESRTGKSAAALEGQEMLLEVLKQGLPPDVSFVLSATEIDKRRAFYKGLSKLAKPTVLDRPDTRRDGWQEAVARIVREKAEGRGLRFDPGALERFVATVGEDSGQIETEMEKLDLFLGEEIREVDSEAVRTITSVTRAGIVWEISGAIAERNLGAAIGHVEYLLAQGENGIGIIRAAVIPEMRKLLGAALIRPHLRSIPGNYGAFQSVLEGLPDSIKGQLPRTKEGKLNAYPLFLAMRGPARYSADEMVEALAKTLETDMRMVTTALDHRLLLTQLLASVIGESSTPTGRAA